MPFHPMCIRFIHPWRGRASGSVNTDLAPGVMETLVGRGYAEWHDPNQDTDESESKPARKKK